MHDIYVVQHIGRSPRAALQVLRFGYAKAVSNTQDNHSRFHKLIKYYLAETPCKFHTSAMIWTCSSAQNRTCMSILFVCMTTKSSGLTEDVGHCMQASSIPLVGVWVSGVATPTHPLVWLACLKFFVTSQLQDKVTQGNEAFLLLLYTTGQCKSFIRSMQAKRAVCKASVTVLSAGWFAFCSVSR